MSRRVRRRVGALLRDESGFVLSFLVKLLVVLTLVGLVIEEAGQIIYAEVRADRVAAESAQAAADDFDIHHNVRQAELAAEEAARSQDPGAKITQFDMASDGTATVTVREVANTLIVHRISFLERYGIQHATENRIHSLA